MICKTMLTFIETVFLMQSSIEMIRSMKGLFDPALADESQLTKINICREVGLKCIEWEPKCRPTMADVLEMLNS